MSTTAITNARVFTMDGEHRAFERGTVVFENRHITAVGSADEVDIPAAATVIDGRDRLAVLPGLIDVHSHSSLLRGFSENAQLIDWLPEYQREHQVLNDEDAYYGSLLNYLEALKGGTTTVMDMFRRLHKGAEAAEALGTRVHLVPYAADHPTKTFFETLQSTADLIAKDHDTRDGRVRVWCGLEHITYCSEAMFRAVRDLADATGVSIHTHTSEQREEVEMVVERFGARPVFKFEEYGILKPGTVLAHCVWLDDAEIATLAGHGVGVAHCPVSNMKLAGGAAPIDKFQAAGITVGLGTDGGISNNCVSMFDSMKTASLVQKLRRLDATALSADETLRMATIDGARLLGVENQVGSLEVGKEADLITVDLWQPHYQPIVSAEGHDPVPWNLVFAGRASDVRDVWVQGRQVLADGAPTLVDEGEVMEAIQCQTRDLLERRRSAAPVPM